MRHFHYWSEYGEEAARPEGLERIRFELQRNRLYFSQGRPLPDTFSVQTDGSLNRELVPVLATLDLADWPGQMEQSALYDLPEKKKRRLCQWHIGVAFEPEKPGAEPLRFSFYGADDGTSPKRLAAEQALRKFFGPKIDALKAATPRRLTGLLWLGQNNSYKFDVEENGIVTLERRKGAERKSLSLYPAFADELNRIEGFPGIYETVDEQAANITLSFLSREEMDTQTSHLGGGFDGFVTYYWYTDSHEIYHADIKYCTDMDDFTRSGVLCEELIQALGMSNDSYDYPYSIFYQDTSCIRWPAPIDWTLIELLYHPALQTGMNEQTVRQILPFLLNSVS